jgi:CheY-like chemotaxis protein
MKISNDIPLDNVTSQTTKMPMNLSRYLCTGNILNCLISNRQSCNKIRPENIIKDNGPSIQSKSSLDNYDVTSKKKHEEIITHIRCLFHDFRGPLNNISMGIDVLNNLVLTKTFDDNFIHEHSDMITHLKQSSEFMHSTLNGFLNLPKINSNDVENMYLKQEPFNLVGLIKKTQFLLIFAIAEKKMKIEYGPMDENESWVIGDANHLQHVIYNILSNAIKFSQKKKRITLHLSMQKLMNNFCKCTISISDENVLIRPSIKNKMFDLDTTSDSSKGTGLGLYICKKIVGLHGGKIYHEYNGSVGNKFTIDLILKTCVTIGKKSKSIKETSQVKSIPIHSLMNNLNENEKHSSTEMRPVSPANNLLQNTFLPQIAIGKLHKAISTSENSVVRKLAGSMDMSSSERIMRIVVVDDSELSRKLLSRLLNGHSYFSKNPCKLYEAVDGLDAITNLHGRIDHISIIFMDNIMPTITGVLASKIIRGLGYKQLIFGITGNGLKEDIDEFIENGADYVFIKPFKKENLDMIFELIDYYGDERIEGKRIVETSDKKGLVWE